MKNMRSRGLKKHNPFSVPKFYNHVKREEILYINKIHDYNFFFSFSESTL